MNYNNRSIISILIILGILFLYIFLRKQTMIHAYSDIKTSKDALALFPSSVTQIKDRTSQTLTQAKTELAHILAIPADQRTYENTVAAFDHLVSFSNATLNASIISTLDLVHPDEAIRNAARDAVLEIQNFLIEVSTNKALYNAFKEYAQTNVHHEKLNDEQKYFLHKTIEDFEHEGLNLPQEKLEQVKTLKKELTELEQQFERNIAQDQSKIFVTQDELAGLPEDFITSLPKDEQGNYIVGVDFPTYMQVMENCTVALTRKKLWHAYMNRAYPINKDILQKIIAKRFELAKLLGFSSFAQYELSDQMVKTPARAAQFLEEIYIRAQKKALIEFKEFTENMHKSVDFAADGKLYPWDIHFVKNQYKKSALRLDENVVAQYFPLQNTVDKLLEIYQQFFNLEFKQLPVQGLWNQDVKLIEVIDKPTSTTIGYLFLDLFPRPNKFSHACEHTIIPVTLSAGKPNKGVVIVIANFPKPMADKPALLKLKDVNTFFHEFGHALHALLGRTQIASFSGTHVKRDFVEMPSQMLEEWLWDPQILKMVSSHYQTHEPLPDDLINTILKSRTYDSGFFIVRQLYLANLSLQYFNNGSSVDPDKLYKKIFEKYMYRTQYIPVDHMYAAFGHLTGYGARYYGYMWSKVFAHDMFAQIKKEGLLNPEMGRKYVNAVIGKGGSKDPNELLKDFLGREPNQEAFLCDMGLQ